MCIGFLAVPLQYGLYDYVHLSKWFVFVLWFKFKVAPVVVEPAIILAITSFSRNQSLKTYNNTSKVILIHQVFYFPTKLK